MAEISARSRDLVIYPGQYAFVLDKTKGHVNVIVGPNKNSMSDTDQTVLWDSTSRRFTNCDSEVAPQSYPNASEGYYLVLSNPAEGKDEHPPRATSTGMADLKIGCKVNIPGPTHFPLWPGQSAKVIEGHHLRSNQYLVVRVYNDTEAKENWEKAVVKAAAPTGTPPKGDDSTPPPPPPAPPPSPKVLTMGQLMVIKGTEVAFFIPPTGIEVVPESGENYVREAVTLERLEYCILLNENGNKRYVQGPAVVFPEPTENFVENTKDGGRKFRAIELNENSGLYVKVIAEYTDEETKTTYNIGDELFITGKDQAIYFPREEHSIIRYGDQTIHYAIAVPSGEGRHVLDRNTGEVRLVKGPTMLLPDPRQEVVVRRILEKKTVELLFPGNTRALEVNQELAELSKAQGREGFLASDVASRRSVAYASQSRGPEQFSSETFKRGTEHTKPRTITLDTKYDGAVAVDVWTGYAILVVSKTGERRVVEGPKTVLLEYNETLMPMELSTGTPKSDDKLFGTAYLRVKNNRVSDVVRVETADMVQVDINLSYRVNFEGSPEKWFAVENYVRFLCDHLRSLIRNTAKRRGIEEFYSNSIDIIRDAVLSKPDESGKRPGRLMEENGMRVYDVEVLDVKISNPAVASLLTTAQIKALESALDISKQERDLDITRRSEAIRQDKAEILAQTEKQVIGLDRDKVVLQQEVARQKAAATAETERAKLVAKKEEIDLQLQNNLAQIISESESSKKQLEANQAEQEALGEISAAETARRKAKADSELAIMEGQLKLELERMKAQTEEIVSRGKAIDTNLASALTSFADSSLTEKMVTALAPMAAMNGVSAADILAQLLKGTPLEGVLRTLATRTSTNGPRLGSGTAGD